MLTGELVRPRLYQHGVELRIEMIDGSDPHWRQTAAELIALFHQHVRQTQEQWHRALEGYEGNRTDYAVIRGLAKVLSDAATFGATAVPIAPAEVRAQLFTRGPVFDTPGLFHPQTRALILKEAAVEYQVSSQQMETLLYADRPAAHVLADAGPDWTPEQLIARYNLELARAALYWSDHMQVQIFDSFKDFWRYLKLFKLMFWATPIQNGYDITLDGPISPFVKSTTRYGRQFAAFLPALFLCQHWQMSATVHPPQVRQTLRYYLNDTFPLPSHFHRSGEFDSRLEADFAAEFHAKFGNERGAWQLTREDEVILLGDTVMIPDFAFTHKKSGRRALVEIVGFWHPDYLERKVAKARAANRRDLILLVYEGVNLSQEKLRDVPAEVLYFSNKPVLKDVMALVEQVAV
jgi:predicted nuclease of restriction endonuclease-like RecB superfamily